MMLIEENFVTDAALPIDAFKAHLRLGTGFGQDDLQDELLGSFLRAAMSAIELRTGKALIERAFGWTLHAWRDASVQPLPVAPVNAITQVLLVARDGSEATVDAASYWLEQDSHRPRLRAATACLPKIPADGAAKVSMIAGYGATWTDLPADLRQAILLLAAHYYEFRSDTGLDQGCMPFGVSSIIERYRAMRIGGGQ